MEIEFPPDPPTSDDEVMIIEPNKKKIKNPELTNLPLSDTESKIKAKVTSEIFKNIESRCIQEIETITIDSEQEYSDKIDAITPIELNDYISSLRTRLPESPVNSDDELELIDVKNPNYRKREFERSDKAPSLSLFPKEIDPFKNIEKVEHKLDRGSHLEPLYEIFSEFIEKYEKEYHDLDEDELQSFITHENSKLTAFYAYGSDIDGLSERIFVMNGGYTHQDFYVFLVSYNTRLNFKNLGVGIDIYCVSSSPWRVSVSNLLFKIFV